MTKDKSKTDCVANDALSELSDAQVVASMLVLRDQEKDDQISKAAAWYYTMLSGLVSEWRQSHSPDLAKHWANVVAEIRVLARKDLAKWQLEDSIKIGTAKVLRVGAENMATSEYHIIKHN